MKRYTYLATGWLRDNDTGAFVSPTNQDFVKWSAEGNTPDPYDGPSVDERVNDAWLKSDAIARSGADDNSRARYLMWMLDPSSSAERKARISAVTAWMDAIWMAYAAYKADPVGTFIPPSDPCPWSFWDIAGV